MVLHQPSKLITGVRFPSPAPKMSHSSSGLGHRGFIPATGVRTSYGTPLFIKQYHLVLDTTLISMYNMF